MALLRPRSRGEDGATPVTGSCPPGSQWLPRSRCPVYIDGPWVHRSVSATDPVSASRERGDGPLVLLLHGFPEFWWTWRGQLSLAERGRLPRGRRRPARLRRQRQAAARLRPDDRGRRRGRPRSGRSARPTPWSSGHDWGGLIGWTTAAYFPKVVRRLAVVSVPHPLRVRGAVLADPRGQGRSSGYALGFQLPLLPERQLPRDTRERVGRMLAAWSGPGWPDAETEWRYRDGHVRPLRGPLRAGVPPVVRAVQFRPDGLRYTRPSRAPIQAPTLHLHGAVDGCVLPSGGPRFGPVRGRPYRWRLIDGASHFPHEERPTGSTPSCGPGWPTRAGAIAPDGRGRRAGRTERDRDPAGRPRNARPRDGLGRPLARGAAGEPRLGPDGPGCRRPVRCCPPRTRWRWLSGCSTPAARSTRTRCWRRVEGRAGRGARPVEGTGPARGRADARAAGQRARRGALLRRGAAGVTRLPGRRAASPRTEWTPRDRRGGPDRAGRPGRRTGGGAGGRADPGRTGGRGGLAVTPWVDTGAVLVCPGLHVGLDLVRRQRVAGRLDATPPRRTPPRTRARRGTAAGRRSCPAGRPP